MDSNLPESTFGLMMVVGIFIMLALALAFVIFFNFSQKKLLNEQMRNQKLAFDYQEELLHSTILTQEQERKRIAEEMHDEIGSKLNIILLNTHRLKKFRKDNIEIDEIAKEVNSVIHKTIATTRRISHDLLPPTLDDFGLVEALKELRDSFEKTKSVSINFELIGGDFRIKDSIVELNIFRVIQELINNSIRHGEAKEISITLELKPSSLKLNYKDNGKGFDLNLLENKKGLGMKNIESRLNMIKASYQYETATGKGFGVDIDLELNSTIEQSN